MEKDTLRRHVYEEIQSQFETKLREAKRQKTQVEEELESLSEKWRSERRRLNAEIDRLEAALADAKDGRKRAGGKNGRVNNDSEELLKAQQAAQEKFKKASDAWEKERSTLQAEIKRLELGLADVLERSNNPMRSAQTLRESVEAKLDEAVRAKQRVEDDYAAAKARWDRERAGFEAEIAKLRRAVASKTREEEEEFQRKLRDLQNAKKALEQEAAELRQKHALETAELQKELQQARSLVGEARIQAEKAQDECKALQATNAEHEARYSSALAQSRSEGESDRKRLADELAGTRQQLESAQRAHEEQLAVLNRRLHERSDAAASDPGLADQLQEAMRHRNFLKQQLHQAEETIRSVRAEQSEEFAQLTAQLQEARVETGRVRKNLERELQKAREEAERTRAEFTAEIESLRTGAPQKLSDGSVSSPAELQELHRHNDELKRQLETAKAAISKVQEAHIKERSELSAKLETVRASSDKAAAAHKEELRKATAEFEAILRKRAPAPGKQSQKDTAKTDDGIAYQLREAMQQRNYLQQQVHQAEETIRAIRAEHAAEKQSLAKQLEDLRGKASQLESKSGQFSETASSEALEKLRKQYDARLHEMTQQKAQLSDELKRANSMMETEKSKVSALAASASPAGKTSAATADQRRVHDEVTRVEGLIQGITSLIDDPSAELSTVIRKNVERAEWDAYLKGILFSLGKSGSK